MAWEVLGPAIIELGVGDDSSSGGQGQYVGWRPVNSGMTLIKLAYFDELGHVGPAAGFGTPTATVTTLSPGTPATVTIDTSGPDTAKIFAFDFGIPQGYHIELQVDSTHTYIQWRVADSSSLWQNLVALSDLDGPPGPTGPMGVPFIIDGTYATYSDIPVTGEPYHWVLDNDTGYVYQYDSVGALPAESAGFPWTGDTAGDIQEYDPTISYLYNQPFWYLQGVDYLLGITQYSHGPESFDPSHNILIGVSNLTIYSADRRYELNQPFRWLDTDGQWRLGVTVVPHDPETFNPNHNILIGGGGSGTQVQSDWDQSDPTQPDYIKNKPTVPGGQVQSNWTQTDAGQVDYIQNKPSLATVATSGSYTDLSNKPTIPAAQVNADWNASSGVAEILHKPTIPAAQVNTDWNASSGVAEILNKPIIPAAQIQSDWLQSDTDSLDYIKNKPDIPDTSDFVRIAGSGVSAAGGTWNYDHDLPTDNPGNSHTSFTPNGSTDSVAAQYGVTNSGAPAMSVQNPDGSWTMFGTYSLAESSLWAAQITHRDPNNAIHIDSRLYFGRDGRVYYYSNPVVAPSVYEPTHEIVIGSAIANLQSQIGLLANLSTTDHSNLVAAVNEVFNDLADYVPVTKTDAAGNTVTVTNNGTLFKASAVNGDHTTFLQAKYNEFQVRSNTDSYGSESVVFSADGYVILERKLYQSDKLNYISQQLYLQDGLVRPQYDYKQNSLQISYGASADADYIAPTKIPGIAGYTTDSQLATWLYNAGKTSSSNYISLATGSHWSTLGVIVGIFSSDGTTLSVVNSASSTAVVSTLQYANGGNIDYTRDLAFLDELQVESAARIAADGTLSQLSTVAKSSLVAAINEVDAKASSVITITGSFYYLASTAADRDSITGMGDLWTCFDTDDSTVYYYDSISSESWVALPAAWGKLDTFVRTTSDRDSLPSPFDGMTCGVLADSSVWSYVASSGTWVTASSPTNSVGDQYQIGSFYGAWNGSSYTGNASATLTYTSTGWSWVVSAAVPVDNVWLVVQSGLMTLSESKLDTYLNTGINDYIQ